MHVYLNDEIIREQLCRLLTGEPTEIPLPVIAAYALALLNCASKARHTPQDDSLPFLERLFELEDPREPGY
jgi:hypothetical protein